MAKLAIIARYDNSGLATLCWEFVRNLKPNKVLLVQNQVNQTFPERFSEYNTRKVEGRISKEDIEWLTDSDVILSFETFYDWDIIREARKKGVKTALMTMYEMTPSKGFPLTPDLLLCPSKLDYDVFKDFGTRVEYLPVPIATDRLIWKKREKAHTFIHSASHGGMSGRKGTQLFLDAIPLVKSDVKFKVFSWKPGYNLPNDSRLEFIQVNFKNYWQLWREGDVLVYPQDYNGICLPIVEAMASGLGVITTDIYPFNDYFPKELMFKPTEIYRTQAAHNLMETDAAKISTESIAEKIDEFANKDISKFSEYGRTWAILNSWDVLKPKYENLLNNI